MMFAPSTRMMVRTPVLVFPTPLGSVHVMELICHPGVAVSVTVYVPKVRIPMKGDAAGVLAPAANEKLAVRGTRLVAGLVEVKLKVPDGAAFVIVMLAGKITLSEARERS